MPIRSSASRGRRANPIGPGRRAHRSVRGLGDQLRPEADTEQRYVSVEQPLDEEVLLPQPGVMVVLVGVHGATEDEDGAVVVDRARGRRAPGEAPFLKPVAAVLDHSLEDA